VNVDISDVIYYSGGLKYDFYTAGKLFTCLRTLVKKLIIKYSKIRTANNRFAHIALVYYYYCSKNNGYVHIVYKLVESSITIDFNWPVILWLTAR